ncbi:hypothetical protein ACFOUP_12265 [Belliella kenyensis]|uniref:Uncharacterized protein n=1 Tax=Belliella kenyensis TaxID=1472724 RepID=A0ABV8EPS0_9BACT|nr:hypothetical protein [Belliella kenyensis]MCH7400738.1 hypothetical protein [Belliella kenyensis]MDN3601975.1 hypothetical protein [Belliella kenyensis]
MIEKTFSMLFYLKKARNLKGDQRHIYASLFGFDFLFAGIIVEMLHTLSY